jgi:hypothetical protein
VWDREWVEVLQAQCWREEGTFEVYPVLFSLAATQRLKTRRRVVLERRGVNPVELFAAQTFIKYKARKKTPFFTN